MKHLDFLKTNGKVTDTEAIHAWLDRQLRWMGNGKHTLVLKRAVKTRSTAQNRLMWLWFACIEQDTGQSQQDIHDYYCMKYLPRTITDLQTGEMVRVPGHTSTLTTEAFTDFLNKVQADAATEMGITLPSPDDLAFEEFEETFKSHIR